MPKVEEKKFETVLVDDLLCRPGRLSRPDRLVVIVRGPPGAGKTYVSKLLKVCSVCLYLFYNNLLKICCSLGLNLCYNKLLESTCSCLS